MLALTLLDHFRAHFNFDLLILMLVLEINVFLLSVNTNINVGVNADDWCEYILNLFTILHSNFYSISLWCNKSIYNFIPKCLFPSADRHALCNMK